MLIKDWMSKTVITIDSEDSLNDAIQLFQTMVISMLPVMNNGKLVGIITDGDVKRAMPSDATTLDIYEMRSLMDSLKIVSVMSRPVETIGSDYTVDEAARLMLRKRISGMPVLDNGGNMEGILTKSDIFRCFVSFTGVLNQGQRFAFKLNDTPGSIRNITEHIRENGGRLRSILTSYDDIEEGYRKVLFHTFDIAPAMFIQLVEKFQATEGFFYAGDLKSGFRKTYQTDS